MSEAFAASGLVRAVGFALVEFVWQGAAIGVMTAVLLIVLRQATAEWRYGVACLGLAAMTIAPVATTAIYFRDGSGARQTVITAQAKADIIAVQTSGPEAMTAAASADPPALLSVQWLEPRLPFVVLIWTSGVALLAMHLSYGWLRLRQIRVRAIRLAVERWPDVVRHAASRFGLSRLCLLVSSSVDVPAVMGFFRPVIVMPASALAGLSPAHLEAILLHELTHLRRADHVVNVIQCGVEVLLFYHPAVWWVSTQIRREREHCCDDVAASLCADRVTYARALTSLEELRRRLPALATGADGGELLHRIHRLIAPQAVSGPRVTGGLVMGVIVTIALLALNAHLGSSPVSAESSVISVVQPPATLRAVAPETALQAQTPPAVVPRVVPVRTAPARPVQPVAVVPSVTPAVDQTRPGTGGLIGVVRDQTGGVVPGARVTVTSVSASVTPALTTDARGEFAITDLPAGAYSLAVTLPGFRTSQNSIQMRAGYTVSVIVSLDVGSLAETVTVASPAVVGQAAAPLRQAPSNPQTADEFFDAAKLLYAQSRFEEAVAMNSRAVALLRTATPEIVPATIPDPGSTSPTAPVRVGGSIQPPRKIRHVAPIYPAEAAAAGIEGVVVLEAIIATDGIVKDLRVLRSVPVLEEAAVNAVRLWAFTPTLLNRVPIEVAMTVTVHFSGR